MSLALVITCLLSVLSIEASVYDGNIKIKLPLGDLIGTTLETRNGKKIFTFRGIRYAESPAGLRRFSDPIPAQPWTGEMDARNVGWMCPQSTKFIQYSEDCLNLDVYSKNLTDKVPVLVYIHGGAFIMGDRFHAQPQYFLDKDIVLVSINYRLGPLGFLSTGHEGATGNYGLKDQVLALKWIRNYIQYFGGDPESVTLIGHSVGGMSTTLHLLSPMSQGLFHKAIIMSGAITLPGKTNITELSSNFSRTLDCSDSDINVEMECLRNVSLEDIMTASNVVLRKFPGLTWNFEIESDFGQEIFIDKDPNKMFAEGNFKKLPMIVGTTKDELAFLAHKMFNNTDLLNILNENFDKIAPEVFQYSTTNDKLQNATAALKYFYFKNQNLMENIDELGKLFSDSLISFGVHRFLNSVRKYTNLYSYRIDFIGRFGHHYDSNGKPDGVFHADDLQYIFVYKGLAPMFTVNDRENIMVERLTHWFTRFAATGNPNSNPNKWTEGIQWPVSNASKLQTLYINEECHLGNEPYQDRFKLWDELFPIPT